MIYLIDAFNLSYKFPELELLMYKGEHGKAREGLLKIFLEFRSYQKRVPEIHFFFDGKREPGNDTKREIRSDMSLYYSHDMSADHLIKEFIKRAPSPGEITVVSSDKEVLRFARSHRCKTETSEDFEKAIQEKRKEQRTPPEAADPGAETDPVVSRDEMLYWRKMFAESKKGKK